MRPFNKKQLNLKDCLGVQPDSILEKRLAFKEGETPSDKPAEEKKAAVDLYNTDFDNKNFATEKAADFKNDLAASIKDIINKVEDLDESQKSKLSLEFTRGLAESVAANIPSITNLVEKTDAKLAGEGKSGITAENANDYMAKVLQALKCNKLGLVYDNTDDKLKFKFYGESGEIKFKESSIKIQYVPENLKEKVVRETYKESYEFKLDGKAGISQDKFKEKVKKETGKDPVEGDRVVIDRFPITLKATYKKLKATDKEAKFYTEDNQPLYLIGGDKVTYYPKQKDKPGVANEVKVGEETYLVLRQIDTTSSYLEVAQAIINHEPDKGAMLEGKEILDSDTADRISRTTISVPEYAELIKKSHEALGKTNRLPIVLPSANMERKGAIKKGKEASEMEQKVEKAKTDAAEAIKAHYEMVLKAVAGALSPEKAAQVKATADKYTEKLNAANGDLKKIKSILSDYWADIDDYFSSSGWTRKISKNVENAMDQGKDNKDGTWYKMWNAENPSAQKVMSTIDMYSDVFKGYKGNINKVRDTAYALIRAGNSSQFTSSDIIEAFGIKLPDGLSYDRVLGMAMSPDLSWNFILGKGDKMTADYQKECRRIVAAVEGLSMDLGNLDPTARIVSTGERAHEKQKLTESGAKSLKKLVDLLQVDKSSEIVKADKDLYTVNVEKAGKALKLTIQEQGTGQYLMVQNPETYEIIYKEWDNFGFDAPDYVAKINQLFEKTAKGVKAEKDGDKMETIDIPGPVTYRSLRELETLHEDVPGIPLKDLLEVKKKKDVALIDNKLATRTRELLQKMGIYEDAKIVDTSENKKNLKKNDSVVLNLRYKGKDLSLRVDNVWDGWNVYLEQGFNKQPTKRIRWEQLQTLQIAETKLAIDNSVNNMGSNVGKMEAIGDTERVQIFKPPFDAFNAALKAHTDSQGGKADYSLDTDQMLEAIFRVYSFEELKKMNCVKRVSSQTKSYLITDLPPLFKEPGKSQELLDLVYAIKYGGNINNEKYKDWTSKAAEKIGEAKDITTKYSKRLKKIFAYGLTDFDSEGQSATMADANTEGKMFDESKDEYFKKASGKAAFNDFYDQVRTRDDKGNEVIDQAKANKRINELYQRGLQRLNLLSKKNTAYAELQKQVNDAAKAKTLSLDDNLTDFETKVVRLGYLSDTESKEADQNKILENVKTKLIENIMTLLPDQISGPKGEKVDKKQAKATLEQLPVGVLLSLGYDQPNDKWSGGVNIPIVLDVFDSKYAKLVLVPGITSDGLQLGVGMAFTNRDPSDKDQIVSFYGGVTVGIGVKWSGDALLFAGVSGGIDFRVQKADQSHDYNFYFGVFGGLGVDLLKGKLGPDVGLKLFEWQIDAQQAYANEYNAALTKEGLKDYVDELARIYKEGSKADAIKQFIDKIKGDKALMEKLDIKNDDTPETILANFEIYIAQFTNDFDEHFDLPPVTGGEIKFSVVSGSIMAAGLATGNILVMAGGVFVWGIQLLLSMNFNVGSKFVHEKHQKTSDLEMQKYGDIEKQKQFDSAFSSLPKEGKAAMYKSGKLTLDAKGEKRADMVVSGTSAEIGADQFGKEMDKLNNVLKEKNIDLKLVKGPDNRIEIVMLDSKVASNDKILISSGIAVVDGNRLFLKDPNKIKFLYIDKQARKYPLETSHGATIETVTTISDNRFYKSDTFPSEIEINRYADTKETPLFIKRVDGKGEAYVDTSTEFAGVAESQGRMKKALDKTVGMEAEPMRENLKKLAKELYQFRNKKGESFVDITNKAAKKNKETPDYVSTELYAFYDEFSKGKKIPDFNGREKQILTLELSTLRYTELQYGKTSATEKSAAYKERMRWNKETLIPFFQKRIDELSAAGKKVTHTAEQLAEKATQDLMKLDTNMPPSKLEKGTSVSVAIGRGANGLHQILDGGDYSGSSDEVDKYGYILGKDYTEALRTATPGDLDYEIALLLVGQLSNLPETSNTKEFMKSNLAMKLASNGGLAFILGKEKYEQVIAYYETGAGDSATPGIARFMEIVKKIRTAEQEGKEIITVEGEKGVKFQIKVNIKVQSGIFNKCANYTSTINEEVSIIPPNETEAMALLASGSEARTTLTTKSYKQFLGFFGGVTATVRLGTPPEPGNPPEKPPKEEEPAAPAAPRVAQRPGDPLLPSLGPGTPQAPAGEVSGPGNSAP